MHSLEPHMCFVPTCPARLTIRLLLCAHSCPCVHPNYYSNQRWCCGDAPHMDLSQDVFKMVSTVGVVRRVLTCLQCALHK